MTATLAVRRREGLRRRRAAPGARRRGPGDAPDRRSTAASSPPPSSTKRARPSRSTIPARALRAGDPGGDPAPGQHGAVGPLQDLGELLHPVRGPRLPAHHLLPRPTGRDGELQHHHRGRPYPLPGDALERQPGEGGGAAGGPAPSFAGRIPFTGSPATCSRSSPATCAATPAPSPPRSGGTSPSRSGSSRRTSTAASTRCARCRGPWSGTSRPSASSTTSTST